MTLTAPAREALIEAVRAVARAEVLPRFRNLGAGEVSQKAGPEDLVTVADRAAEAALSERIAAILPDAAIVGEEAVAGDAAVIDRLSRTGLCAVIDPVDGTWNYAHGLAVFGMILAVLDGGRCVFGLLYDPLMDDWVWAGTGEGAWYGRAGAASRRLAVAPEKREDEQAGYLPLYAFAADARPALAAAMPAYGRVQSLRCSCHEYRMMALGHADWTVSAASNVWDHAAGMLAVTEAGGAAGRLAGGEARWSETGDALVAATGAKTLQAVRSRLGGALS